LVIQIRWINQTFPTPVTKIALKLGVSDKAVEKHIKKLGLTKPPRGYWMKVSVDAEGIEPNLCEDQNFKC
tara:strand:+ start:26678 stop:26887 length:210 start_codon:yes stop_codon:yes gene_type:complete